MRSDSTARQNFIGIAVLAAFLAAFLAPFLVLSTMRGDLRQGTLVICIVSRNSDYVLVAADSRETDRNHKRVGDDACKVIELDSRTLFVATGAAAVSLEGGKSWNSAAAARNVYAAAKYRHADSLATQWGDNAVSWFRARPTKFLDAVSASDGGLVTGAFVTFEGDGHALLRGSVISYERRKRTVTVAAKDGPPGRPVILGIPVATALVSELWAMTTPRAVNALAPFGMTGVTSDPIADVGFVKKAFRFAIENATGDGKDEVGYPIDIAILRKVGPIEWVERKASCAATH